MTRLNTRPTSLLRAFRYIIEAIFAWATYGILNLLPVDITSAMGGKLARNLGPRLKVHQVALRNLHEALPHLTEDEKTVILTRMWDNLGRTMGEYPHLRGSAIANRYTVEGLEHLAEAQQHGKPILFMSGHFGNPEMSPFTAALHGLKLLIIYRPANNPLVDGLLRWIRSAYSERMEAKGMHGAFGIVRAIKSGQNIGMLVDQKMNDGIPIPFFGRDAMTAPAIARFALKYGLPVLPARAFRTEGVHFAMKLFKPLYFTPTGDDHKDIRDAMVRINALLEEWVRQDPAQWFWVHRRWGK